MATGSCFVDAIAATRRKFSRKTCSAARRYLAAVSTWLPLQSTDSGPDESNNLLCRDIRLVSPRYRANDNGILARFPRLRHHGVGQLLSVGRSWFGDRIRLGLRAVLCEAVRPGRSLPRGRRYRDPLRCRV